MPTWLFSSCSAQCTSAWMHRSGYGWVWVIDFDFDTLELKDLGLLLGMFFGALVLEVGMFATFEIKSVSPISASKLEDTNNFGCFSRFGVFPRSLAPGVFSWSFGVVAMSLVCYKINSRTVVVLDWVLRFQVESDGICASGVSEKMKPHQPS